ncbi:hypothetical protein PR003_g18322 [Phytophthora rubi]|uniref:Uncharacterized protein n=1 Tax=Phytophthora rubi TaxID=129364 RepID=A0A6A3KNS5_9STRA|nr:hypothetical protein PR001_g17438 [Phytophthora rubi]KAE9318103.1 hypothetical protein PR003_g18322 [Phytophthora rubi]
MNAGNAATGERSTYEETLERWALHDCSSFEDSRGDAEIISLFERWMATRRKPATVRGAVDMRTLDRSWTAFVERWNMEGATAFIQKLEAREETHARLSSGELTSSVCEASWEADRRCCFVHFRMGYRCCRGYGLPRPSEAEWRQITNEMPLSESDRAAVGRYEAALSEARRGAPPRRLEEPNPRQPPQRDQVWDAGEIKMGRMPAVDGKMRSPTANFSMFLRPHQSAFSF